MRADRRSEVELLDKSLLFAELARVTVCAPGAHPLQQLLRAEIEPNHPHSSLSCSLKSMKQIFPGRQDRPFGGERFDTYHSVSESKVVLGQASDGFIPIDSSQRR